MKIKYLFITLFIFCLCSCAELFQPKVSMDISSTQSLTDLLSTKKVITKLSTPEQVFVSQGTSPTTIQISWTEVEGAISYYLERAIITDSSTTIPTDDQFSVINNFVYATNYTDKILSSPDYTNEAYTNHYKYYYRVTAENKREDYDSSDPSTPVYGYLFEPVLTVSADLGKSSNNIQISWTKTNNASNYEIYRTENSNGTNAELIKTITANVNFYNCAISESEQGIEYYFIVYALNSSGEQSVASPLAMGFALMAGAPPAPSDSSVEVSNGRGDSISSIGISWQAVTAESTVHYTIYRSSSVDSAFTLLIQDTTSTSFNDTSLLKTGIYYYYSIQAWIIDADTGTKLKSSVTDTSSTSETPCEGFILSPPSTIQAIKQSNGQIISWTPAIGSTTEQESYTYNLYGCSEQNGTYSLIQSDIAPTLNSDSMVEYSPSQTASFYKVSTVNGLIESTLSQAVSPAPYAAENLVVTKYANLGSDYQANSSGVYPVKLTWSKPENDDPAGYLIYRSTKPESSFRKITDTPITNLVYIDTNETAKSRTYYYYKVLAVNTLDQGINFSTVNYGYGALSAEQYMREYNKTVMNSQKKLTLMHKSNDLDKLGTESVNGEITGTLSYDAHTSGLGAEILMHYTDYCDWYITDSSSGCYFKITGDTNTNASMDASGSMNGTVTCTGMYPGKVYYDNIEIKSGAAGGGTYGIEQDGFTKTQISYTVGNE